MPESKRKPWTPGRKKALKSDKARRTFTTYMTEEAYLWLVERAKTETDITAPEPKPGRYKPKYRVSLGSIVRRAVQEYMEKENAARQASNGKHEGHARHVDQAAKAAVQTARKGITPRVR